MKKNKRKKSFRYVVGRKYDSMMSRCYRETDASYKHYGERGIKVCSQWIKNIDSFIYWAITELQRQNISMEEFVLNSRLITLDRINGNDHYSSSNCKFSSNQQQQRNSSKRKKKIIVSAEGEKILI